MRRQVNVRFSEEEFAALVELADGEPMASVVRGAVRSLAGLDGGGSVSVRDQVERELERFRGAWRQMEVENGRQFGGLADEIGRIKVALMQRGIYLEET